MCTTSWRRLILLQSRQTRPEAERSPIARRLARLALRLSIAVTPAMRRNSTATVMGSAVSRLTLAVALAALVITPVSARQLPTTGGWEIYEDDPFCYMWSDFEGPGDTELSLALNIDGRVMLQLRNTDWSVKDGESYKLAADMKDLSIVGEATGSKASAYPYKKGLMGTVSVPGFLAAFAKSPNIHFYLDSTDSKEFDAKNAIVLDKLKLGGSGVAIAAVQRCTAELKRKADAAARAKAEYEARWRTIPKDPFAKPEAPKK